VPDTLLRLAPLSPSPSGEERVAPPPSPTPGGERPGAAATAPPPPVAAVLAVIPPVVLSAVERGLHQFLGQLERLNQRLAGDEDGNGLWPWVVAGAAAATACEIARRQLRRPAGVPADPPFTDRS
jgi:hypothetical protein